MRLEPQAVSAVTTRLKRAHGHLGSVIRMLETGAEYEDVLTQLAAVNKAIGRAGYALVMTGLQQYLADEHAAVDRTRLERLFLAFA